MSELSVVGCRIDFAKELSLHAVTRQKNCRLTYLLTATVCAYGLNTRSETLKESVGNHWSI